MLVCWLLRLVIVSFLCEIVVFVLVVLFGCCLACLCRLCFVVFVGVCVLLGVVGVFVDVRGCCVAFLCYNVFLLCVIVNCWSVGCCVGLLSCFFRAISCCFGVRDFVLLVCWLLCLYVVLFIV